MKLKTKIRAGKIRPNHNVTVHRTAASSFVNAGSRQDPLKVVISADSTRGGSCNSA
jgi:hypothetical protein